MYLNQQKTQRSARHVAQRRGVRSATPRSGFVLILVIVMLGLLAIVGVSFTQFATQEVQSSTARNQAFSHHQEQGEVEQQLDDGLASVLVGSNNQHDFTHGHEILRDLYGGDGQKVWVAVGPQGNRVDGLKGEIELVLEMDQTAKFPTWLNPLPGYYRGRQLVFSSGRFKGTSVRILDSGPFRLFIPTDREEDLDLFDVTKIRAKVDSSLDLTSVDLNKILGDAIIIGRPFNGAGMGVYPQNAVSWGDLNLDGQKDDAWSWRDERLSGGGFITPPASDGLPDQFTPNFFYSGLRPEAVWVNANGTSNRPTLVPYGGFDEDYDYPDFQNMFLGLVRHRLVNVSGNPANPNWRPVPVVEQPSFHRPGMIERWRQPALLGPEFYPWLDPHGRTMMLRPRPVDQRLPGYNGRYGDPLTLKEQNGDPWDDIPHPGVDRVFGTRDDIHPGENQVYAPLDGNGDPTDDDRFYTEGFPAPFNPLKAFIPPDDPDSGLSDRDLDGVRDGYRVPATAFKPAQWVLDVDNDGDGTADGVWVDLGKPVRTTTDGRRVKPLYSFLIVDLDSRLNLNVHGQLNDDRLVNRHTQGGTPTGNGDGWVDSHLSVHPGTDGVRHSLDDKPVGSGWSVAEINLQNVFKAPDDVDFINPNQPDPDYVRANLEYLRVLAGKVGNTDVNAGMAIREIVPGRYGERNMLWDKPTMDPPDGLPDLGRNDNSSGYYPKAGYTYSGGTGDDDRPGDLYTRLFYDRSYGDYLAGTLGGIHPVLGTLIPSWYRNPPDFDGDGILGLNRPLVGQPIKRRGWPWYGPSMNPLAPASLAHTWGWGAQFRHEDNTEFKSRHAWRGTTTEVNYPLWNPGELFSETLNEADEIDLVNRKNGPDAVYGAEDLTWLNLAHELSGSELVSRLSKLAPYTFGTARTPQELGPYRKLTDAMAAHNRRLVTTDSWDLTAFSAPPATQADHIPPNLLSNTNDNRYFYPGQGSGTVGVGGAIINFYQQFQNDNLKQAAEYQLGIFQFYSLLPDEIRAGFRLDLNRPFGDGIDNQPPGSSTGNGVIDEDLEAGFDRIDNDGDGFINEVAGEPGAFGDGWPNLIDDDGDGLVDEADELVEHPGGPDGDITTKGDNVPGPRQRFARDLYMLLYLVAMKPGGDRMPGTWDDTPRFSVPWGFFQYDFILQHPNPDDTDTTSGYSNAPFSAEAADYLAQLAVNIVDFRDSDSVMTGFEYDRWPGGGPNGWNVTGNLTFDPRPAPDDPGEFAVERGVVWGVERPQVLLNETLGIYDTRDGLEKEEDQNNDPGQASTDRDQSYVWVELYNPNDPNHPLYPPVDLAQTVVGVGGVDEVWRMVISQAPGPLTASTMGRGYNGVEWNHNKAVSLLEPDGTGNPYPYRFPLPGSQAGTPVHSAVRVIFTGQSPRINGPNGVIPAYPGSSSPDFTIINAPNAAQGSAKYGAVAPLLQGDQYLSVGSLPTAQSGTNLIELGGSWPAPTVQILEQLSAAGGQATATLDTGLVPSQNYLIGGSGEDTRRGTYLQRLADPTLPWHVEANPYVTIDAMLTKVHVLDSTDYDDVEKTVPTNTNGSVASFERQMPFVGRAREFPSADAADEPVQLDYQGGQDHSLQGLHQSLDSINENTDEFLNPMLEISFPWFTFYDRMFASPTELMHVPGTRPERLTNAFSTYRAYTPEQGNLGIDADFYTPSVPSNPQSTPKPFPHLVPWLESDLKTDQYTAAGTRKGLYRFFEFVEVPSRFSGVDTNRNPVRYKPPYHYQRGHRVPGKINLNTVYEPEVFAGLFNNHPSIKNRLTVSYENVFSPDFEEYPLWNHLKAKMEVRTQPPMNPYQALGLDVRRDGWNYYSYRLNPIPLLQLPRTWGTDVDRPFRSYAFGASPLGDVNDTFFRQMIDIDPNEAPPNNIEKSFLFDWLHPSFNEVKPAYNPFPLNPWQNEDSEPEQQSPFRFQLLQKLGNGATTRSNVFAIWVTVGYFEVLDEPSIVPYDRDGDGLVNDRDERLPRLGQELGYATGETERHRAFYVIDRTRSSGWHPDLEIDPSEMILVRKIIE